VRPVLSPIALVIAVIGLLLGALSGSLPWAIVGAVVGWAVGAGIALVWKRTTPAVTSARIDPFTVGEPWRRAVQDALQARNRFTATMATARAGPFHDQLADFAARIDRGVEESWRIAQQGQSVTDARRRINTRAAESELATLDAGSDLAAALRAQREAADRLDRTLEDTRQRLRVLNARLDEAVARAAELSVEASRNAEPAVLAGIGAEIDDVVTDMEALRAALEEVDSIGRPPSLPGEPDTASS
jgi:hypothetical protein